jgi:hypothetical protein
MFGALATFVLSLSAYLGTLSPSVGPGDAGELIVAAEHLGVPHPPGYPAWCLIGHLFSAAVPWGEVAWRFNFMTALFAALASAVITALLALRGVRLWISVASGLLFAVSETVWSQAVCAEVYTLSAFSVSLVLMAQDRWTAQPNTTRCLWLGASIGLAFAAHPLSLVIAPALLFDTFRNARDQLRSWRFWLAIQTAWIGVAAYAIYLPVAAASDPILNWGDPVTFERWLSHVSRAQYGGYQWPGVETTIRETLGYLSTLAREIAVFGLVPMAFGSMTRRERSTRPSSELIGWVVAGPLFFATLAGMLRDEQLFEIGAYGAPALIFAIIMFGRGMNALAQRIAETSRPSSRAFFAISTTIVVFSMVAVRWPLVDRSGNWVAQDYASALLESMPRNAALEAQGDFELFPLMYVQSVEGVRPDVALFDASEPYELTDIYGWPADRHQMTPRLVSVPVSNTGNRTVPWELAELIVTTDDRIHDGFQPVPPPPLRHPPPKDPMLLGYWDRGLLTRYHLSQARFAFAIHEVSTAEYEIRRGATIGWDSPKSLNNLAVLSARNGRYDLAATLWRRALRLDSTYDLAAVNLSRLNSTVTVDEPDSFRD